MWASRLAASDDAHCGNVNNSAIKPAAECAETLSGVSILPGVEEAANEGILRAIHGPLEGATCWWGVDLQG